MSREKKKNEYFDAFLEKEILTANRYDGSAGETEREQKEGPVSYTHLRAHET